ncbi:MAG TPA: sel1 repeat family protein [Ghiorsea sp.]|nr:sel1 repeat family protein [Ghiorsea sp.]
MLQKPKAQTWINRETLPNRSLWSDIRLMKILLPLLLLVVISAGGLFYISSDTVTQSSDTDMLQLGNFAFQQQRYDDALQWYTKAALQGEREAQFQLAQMYARGQGVEQNDELALNWMRKAAHNRLNKAEFAYANMLFFGRGLAQKDTIKALVWYERAAKRGQPEAMLKLASLYFEDTEQHNNLYASLDWVLKAKSFPVTANNAKLLHSKIVNIIQQQAQAGEKRAQYEAAKMYKSGIGVTKDLKKARKWFYQSARQGHVEAQFQLGMFLLNNTSNTKESARWLSKAAKNGHSQAGYMLAPLLTNFNIHNRAEIKESWRWLYHGMRNDEPKTLYNFAVILHQGQLSLPKSDGQFQSWLTYAANINIPFAQNDIAVFHVLQKTETKKSLQWLERAAKSGDVAAQFNLGLLFARGDIFSPNDEQALYWWKLAEQNGNNKAQMMLALFYHLGRGVGRSEEKAIDWYEKAATSGHRDALYNLAMIYYYGRGVEQNYKKAAAYLNKLANKGDAEAQNLYASLFLDGKGVTYNPQTAITWFSRAAKAGNTFAMFNLATQYRSGNGIAQDDTKAMFWYKKAAERNYAPAQNAIGYLYAEGRGTKKNIDKAEEWFYKANDNGLRVAGKNLSSLHQRGSFSLVTLQITTDIRTDVLTNKNLDLSQWLEVHHQPIF